MKRRKSELLKQKEKVKNTDINTRGKPCENNENHDPNTGGNHVSSDIQVKSIFTRLLGGTNDLPGKENEHHNSYHNTPSSSSKRRYTSCMLLNRVNKLFYIHTYTNQITNVLFLFILQNITQQLLK